MNGRFVTFHGIDGTGKTTAVERVVTQLSELEVPIVQFDEIDQAQQALIDPTELAIFDPSARASISKKMTQSEQVRIVLENGISVAKDRWAIDVYASHAFKGDRLPDFVPARIVRPHLAVILTCLEDERQARITKRGNPTEDDLVANTPGTRAYFFEQYLLHNMSRFALRTLTIDTTTLEPDEITEIVTLETGR